MLFIFAVAPGENNYEEIVNPNKIVIAPGLVLCPPV